MHSLKRMMNSKPNFTISDILIDIWRISVTVFIIVLLIIAFHTHTDVHENTQAIFNIEFIHLMEQYGLTIQDVQNIPEHSPDGYDIWGYCYGGYVEHRFYDQCVESIRAHKNTTFTSTRTNTRTS